MTDEAPGAPVKAKVYLVDPATLGIVWMNESAAEPVAGVVAGVGVGIGSAIPMAEPLGLPAAVREVAETGVARHLRADVISTAQGSMGISISLYLLPDGYVLVVAEHAWRSGREGGDGESRRPRRRSR